MTSADPTSSRAAPVPLRVTAVLVALEGLALAAYGVAELLALSAPRAAMGATTAVFFLVGGGALVLAGWGLLRLRSWVRAPVVLTELIVLGLAWSFRGGSSGTTVVSAVLGVVGLAALGGIFHPASMAALGPDPDQEDGTDGGDGGAGGVRRSA